MEGARVGNRWNRVSDTMTTQTFRIGPKMVGTGCPVFFVAEAGVNHNGDIELAKRMVESAREAGADAVKFQTFKAENLNTKTAPKSTYHVETTGADSVQSWFDLLKSEELTREKHVELVRKCRDVGIIFLSTPYDEECADLLEELDVPAFKVASTDANNFPLLRHIARKGRPIILSTAMCTIQEVHQSVEAIRAEGLSELVVLHCTGNYPAALSDTNMRAMVAIREELGVQVGYSDHTMEFINPVLAVALGAAIYEKHFTLDRSLPGPDHRMSLTVDELKYTIQLVRHAETALGSPEKKILDFEKENRIKLRKSLVAKTDLSRGQVLGRSHITAKRPGDGLPPSEIDGLIGKRLRADVVQDEKFNLSMIE